MKVLISAYSCQPNYGSEAGNGWNWAWHLAELGHEVWVLTLIDNQKAIEEELILHPIPNLHFVYIAIPQWIQRWIKRYIKISISNLGWQSEYLGWQRRASKIAHQLDGQHGFDIIHHVTWASITGGSLLWRLNKPFVFGPVGGGQVTPPLFKQYFQAHQWRKEAARSFLQKSAQFNLFSRQTVSQADLVLATNSETYDLARQLGANRVELAAVIGISQSYIPPELPTRSTSRELRLLWVGSPIPTKACPLALEALAKVEKQIPWKLTVVGFSNSNHDLIKLIKELGIENQVNCKGRLSWSQLKQEYLQSDVFLFTSLRNSLGAQLFEAMACGLPIITLDHQGAKDFVPENAGIKVPVSNPTQTVNLLAQAVEDVYHNPQKRKAMSKFGYEFAKTQTWSHKAQEMSKYYEELVTLRAVDQ